MSPSGTNHTIRKRSPRRPTARPLQDLIRTTGGYDGAKASIAQCDPMKASGIVLAGQGFSTMLMGHLVNGCILDPTLYPQEHRYDGRNRTLEVQLSTLLGKLRPPHADRVDMPILRRWLAAALGVEGSGPARDMMLVRQLQLCIALARAVDSSSNFPLIDQYFPKSSSEISIGLGDVLSCSDMSEPDSPSEVLRSPLNSPPSSPLDLSEGAAEIPHPFDKIADWLLPDWLLSALISVPEVTVEESGNTSLTYPSAYLDSLSKPSWERFEA